MPDKNTIPIQTGSLFLENMAVPPLSAERS